MNRRGWPGLLAAAAALVVAAGSVGAQTDSTQLWRELVSTGDPRAAFAMGERLVSAGGPLTNQVWIRGALAHQYQSYGDFRRGRELVDEGLALAASWRFRAMPDGGEPGYRKHRALHQLQRAQCQAATALHRHADAATSCRESLASAQRAHELARYSNQGLQGAMGDVLNGTLDLARAEREAGHLQAAQQQLRAATTLVDDGRTSRGQSAHFYRVASMLAIDMGERRQAQDWAQRAVTIWDSATDSAVAGPMIQGRHTLQRALVFAGDWQAAIQEFDAYDTTVRRSGVALAARPNLLARSLAYAHTNRLARLQTQLANATNQSRSRLGEESPLTAVYEGLQGAALLAGGRTDAVLPGRALLARAAERLLEAQRVGDAVLEGGLEAQAARFVLEQFLRAQQGAPGSEPEAVLAFQVADALRGSKVQAAIQDAAARTAASAAGLAELVRQEQDIRNEIRGQQELLAGLGSDEAGAASDSGAADLRQRLGTLQQARAALQARIAQAFPAYTALVNPKTPTPADVVRQLALGELFVLLLPVDDGVHLWALSWTEQRHLFVPQARGRLAAAVAAIRRSTELDSGPVKPYAANEAWQLYQELLAPLDKSIAQARHLVVAAGGVLGSVPFAALPTTEPGAETAWLIRRLAVSQVPSASAWLAIQRLALSARPQQSLLAWGDPSFDGRQDATAAAGARRSLGLRAGSTEVATMPRYAELPPLPETRDELQAIAATLKADPRQDLLLGTRATRASVIAASASGLLATRRVVAFATHGLVAGDLPNLTQPALALAATPDAETNPLSPLLTLDDVLGLRLNADWVVLSACNTAAADGRAEEALSGLARGFFYAGARSVLVTHWAVETESAKLLTTHTFEHYTANPYAGKAESLRQAMLQVMAMPKYQHPAFWAPYALVGDGAR